jgi:hypothetical protein
MLFLQGLFVQILLYFIAFNNLARCGPTSLAEVLNELEVHRGLEKHTPFPGFNNFYRGSKSIYFVRIVQEEGITWTQADIQGFAQAGYD